MLSPLLAKVVVVVVVSLQILLPGIAGERVHPSKSET